MKELSVRDTRAALSHIEEILEREGEIVVTRHGKPVARIVPARPAELPTHAELRASLPVLPFSIAELIRQDRDDEW